MTEFQVTFTTTITVSAEDIDDAETKAAEEFDKDYGKSENFYIYVED